MLAQRPRKKFIVAVIFAILFLVGLIFVSYNMYRASKENSNIVHAAEKSLQFIDIFYKEKGYYPCSETFYKDFWNKEFQGITYTAYCDSFDSGVFTDGDTPHSFLLCYWQNGVNSLAFGKLERERISTFKVDIYETKYCVASPQNPINSEYPDYRQFLGTK